MQNCGGKYALRHTHMHTCSITVWENHRTGPGSLKGALGAGKGWDGGRAGPQSWRAAPRLASTVLQCFCNHSSRGESFPALFPRLEVSSDGKAFLGSRRPPTNLGCPQLIARLLAMAGALCCCSAIFLIWLLLLFFVILEAVFSQLSRPVSSSVTSN